MKRVLLPILLVGLLAGQASAGMYVFDQPLVRQFDQISPSATDLNLLRIVIDNPGTLGSMYYARDGLPLFKTYGAIPMKLDVGLMGDLGDADGDNKASLRVGANPGVGGNYDGLGTWIANDDDDPWSVRLFLSTSSGTSFGGSTTLAGYSAPQFLTWSFSATNFSTVTAIGVEITGDFTSGVSPSNPDSFHISLVPLPGAVLLGFLGLGAAGLGLRRLA